MTIHSAHPFATPPGDRAPLRRFRGRMSAPVSLWTSSTDSGLPPATGSPEGRTDPADGQVEAASPGPGEWAGLTVSSFVVVDGEPGALIGMVDPDSDLAALAVETGRVAVSLLTWSHRDVADVHAGLAPSPGGAFRTGRWQPSPWGPVVADASAWLGGAVVTSAAREVGWSLLLEARIEHIHLTEPDDSAGGGTLVHRRGRYERG